MRRGLTLIEVAVGLALGAALCAMLVSILVHTRRATDLIAERETSVQRARLPFETLAADLRNRPRAGVVKLSQGVLSFETLNALAPPTRAARFAVEVRYGATPHAGQPAFIRAERAIEAADNHLVVSLAAPIESLRFAVSDGRQWFDNWPPGNRSGATAVRLSLQAAGDLDTTRVIALAPLRWTAQ